MDARSTTIINVSNRLPVTIADDGIKKSSGGLVAALEGLPRDQYDLLWLGWPGAEIADLDRQRALRQTLRDPLGCVPVFLARDEVDGHYEGFANSSLWPLLHYMPSNMRYEAAWWDHYRRVNQRFADEVCAAAKPGDLVWVHDYQLMLLPAMLKSAMPSLRVGFFLHTPFPAYEVFRFHPKRAELVEGVLAADLVGFHTFGYLRHFRESILRLLGTESELTRVRYNGHTARVGIFPIGINASRFDAELSTPAFAEELAKLRAVNTGRQLVVSVERLDYTKGILRRLKAIELFLAARTPAERERVKFVFVSIPSREGVEVYRELREEVATRIGRINGTYATLHASPIHFIHGSVNFTELCALYAAADVALVTPLVDGMNLVAKEYVACKRDGEPGVLVLSEFAGAAEELFNAVLVNPYDPPSVADSLQEALSMPAEERRARMRGMRQRVTRFDAAKWARSFIGELVATPDDVAAAARAPKIDEVRRRLTDAIARGGCVALFLDYDGTLREIERMPSAARPTEPVRRLLSRLAACRGLDVTVISGRVAHELEGWLGEFNVGLVAEHGAALRRPGHAEWERLDRNENLVWRDEVAKVLHAYEESTPGSFVEQKRTSLVWHYRRVEPEFGDWKARQLAHELRAMLANEPVTVRHGRKIVEVTAMHINKGAAVARALEERRYDLVICAGDDTTDESMFQLNVPNLVSIKVGEGETRAQLTLTGPANFRGFLEDVIAAAAERG